MTDRSSREAQIAELAKKLAAALQDAFEQTVTSRREHFEAHPDQRPSVLDAEGIIDRYANQNFLVAGAANLIPGPLGMLAALPELTLILRHQIQMIYDLGVAHGKESQMTPTVLLGVFASSLGEGAVGLASVEGRNLLIKRASLRVMQGMLQWIATKVSQRLIKHLLAKWVPVAGAVVIAVWSRKNTAEIGERAKTMLQYDITLSDEELDELDVPS